MTENDPSGGAGELRWVALGIDPGLTGGVAALGYTDRDEEVVRVYPMPVRKTGSKKEVDGRALYILLGQHALEEGSKPVIAVERVHSMKKQGVVSTFTFGTGYGKVLAAVEILGLPLVDPLPDQWKNVVLKGRTKGKIKGRTKGKADSIAFCRDRYPDVSLRPTAKSRVDSHGLADALCLAEYALRQRIRQVAEGGKEDKP